ncbi:MAG: phosphogluconate dehydrogenase (NAD(+)-dependent, decarboxylating) [Nanobdellota archaeon]
MKIGFIGLGKMGKNMVYNLLDNGHEVVANNRSNKPIDEVSGKGAIPAYTISEMIQELPSKKVIWVMVPASVVGDIIEKILPYLKKGDTVIDGGNSWYKDSIKRYEYLKKKGINFLDVGTSGGISGARHGACMMIGGNKDVFNSLEKLFKDMTVNNGYGYMGKTGSGHFVKMVHNGIEYGMMGAIVEGMNAIKEQKGNFDTDLNEVAKVYSNGSIIQSRLVGWLKESLQSEEFNKISGEVPKGATEDEMEALEKISEMKVLQKSREMRVNTRKNPDFKGKLLSAIRNQFGGHSVIKNDDKR